VVHVAFADTLQEAWSAVVGLPCRVCNAEATAFDGKRLYVVGTRVGSCGPLDPDTGGDACVALSGGVTVAEGSIFATCDQGAQGGWIVAYV
jgi:hypothetical protein